jgi:hypothetical protein
MGPLGVGHYPYACAVSPSNVCEPREGGDQMVSEIANGISRRLLRR